MKRRTPLSLPKLNNTRERRHKQVDSQSWISDFLPQSLGKNTTIDTSVNKRPILLVSILGGIIFVALFFQLTQLQLVQGDRLRGIADGNRVRERVTYAPRGRILDRNGVVLTDNKPSFQLSVTPFLLPEAPVDRAKAYTIIAQTISLAEAQIAAKSEAEGIDYLQPLLITEGIDYQTALRLEYQLPKLAGFSLDAVPTRDYNSQAGLAHILGYVGRAAAEDLAQRSELYPIDFVGRMGIEQQYDDILRGQNGIVETEVDASGRPLRTLREIPTKPGEDIKLTIDYKLQQQLSIAIKKQMVKAGVNKGAGVIIEPNTGEVLAMVSLPAYDNNDFARGISTAKYESLLSDPLQPMFNRAISGGYPSGSIIKPLTLIGALESKTVDENTIIYDGGSIVVPSVYDPSIAYTFLGWNPAGLGAMDARRAIALSSNIYFYTVAGGYRGFAGMGIDNLVKYYKLYGLGNKTGVDLPGETSGLVPTPAWKQENLNESWFVGDTYNLGIGQGNLLVSPLQMARAHSTIINGGKLLQPQLRKDLTIQIDSKPKVDPHNYQIIQEGMRGVVSGGGTTSPAVFANVGVNVAGKSGTAETNPGQRKPHAWFSAYAPYENPELLAVVLLEEGEGGSAFAAPAIADAFEWYFKQ